ncbi:peptide ABC transporter substrate-binding protein [Oleiharenicola lentus]|uniref:peptide ABC transporter substrate-binding protein n=1 Tax=Oleiharenicola lentus TaxID=2508720 RepID=UPI003F66990F
MITNARFHGWIGLVLLALCGALGSVFVVPRESLPVEARPAVENNVLRVVYTQPLTPDPHRRMFPVSTYNHFTLCLWEPLIECDPASGDAMPAAAESWQWSQDYRVLTLKIRADARWSNGEPVTADDYVRGWLRLLRQGVEVAYTLFPLKNAELYHRGDRTQPEAVGVHALDARTLQIELDQPRVTMVAELADPLLAPLHATTEQVLQEKTYLKNANALVTNGPFKLAEVDGDTLRLVASDQYHDRIHVELAGVNFLRVNSLTAGSLLVASGKADLLSPVGPTSKSKPPTERALTTESELALGVVAIYFNTSREPLQDVRVRQALALVIERSQLIDESEVGRLVPASSWVPDMPGRKGLQLFKRDVTAARRLLAEAGYPDGVGLPVLSMCLPAWLQGNPKPALCTEQWFQELGVRTYISYDQSTDRSTSKLGAGDYDVTFGALVATVPDAGDLLSTFLMPAIYSETKWSDAETTRLLTTANRKTGAERLQWLEKAERRAMAAVPVVPLMFERRQVLRAREVEGWYPDPLARQSLKHLRLKTAEPARESANVTLGQ